MAELFNRDLKVNVGGIEIAIRPDEEDEPRPTLRVSFKVDRNTGTEPNTAQLSIYNLRKDNRVLLQQGKDLRTVVDAGYVGFTHTIFDGDLRHASSVRDGTNWVTSLQSGDGAREYLSARINKAFKKGVTAAQLLDGLAAETGIKPGNLEDAKARAAFFESLGGLQNGRVFSGSVQKFTKELAKALGFEYSIQNGAHQFLEPGAVLTLPAVVLAPGTGLVGSPEPGEKGMVSARSLLQPDLMPGRQVKLESREVDGHYKVTKVVFVGDTWGNEWYSDVELRPL